MRPQRTVSVATWSSQPRKSATRPGGMPSAVTSRCISLPKFTTPARGLLISWATLAAS